MLLLSEDALLALGAVLGLQAKTALLDSRDARVVPHVTGELPA